MGWGGLSQLDNVPKGIEGGTWASQGWEAFNNSPKSKTNKDKVVLICIKAYYGIKQ